MKSNARNSRAVAPDDGNSGLLSAETPPADEAIYQEIYGAIVDHRLPPGTRLREEPLGEAFGVSRTRIRKVLQQLGHSQIVELHPNRGAFVAQPSVEEAREIFAARRIVEAGLVAALASSASPRQIEQLRAFVAKERKAQRRGDQSPMIRLSGEFHLKIAEMVGNRPLLGFLRELVSRTSLIIALYESPGGPPCNSDDHACLVDLIATGATKRAVEIMGRHLHTIEDSLRLEPPGQPVLDLREVFGASGRRRSSKRPMDLQG